MPAQTGTMSKKILIIEDHPDVRDNLSEILMLSGYTVVAAENGKKGVELAMQEAPDLILCDVMMPELDGYGVLHILSKNPKTADVPFVFLTAKSEKEDFRKGMSLGADDYITKPFDDVQLLQNIETRLSKSERLKASQAQAAAAGRLDQFINESHAQELLQGLSQDREVRHYKKKDLIFSENESPRWLYYIESGYIKLFKTNDDGRELILKVAKDGDFMGYLALLSEGKYVESASALTPVVVRLIPREDFSKLVYGNRDVTANFIKLLANSVAEREQQLLDLAYNSVRKRSSTALVYLYDRGSTHISLLREDLAALAGTAKETFIRTLTDFKNEGLIDIEDGVIVIKKIQKLRDMPN